jgi:hypothetical protein
VKVWKPDSFGILVAIAKYLPDCEDLNMIETTLG